MCNFCEIILAICGIQANKHTYWLFKYAIDIKLITINHQNKRIPSHMNKQLNPT